jgi:hypothetical protein
VLITKEMITNKGNDLLICFFIILLMGIK